MRNTGRGGEEKRCLLGIVGSRYEEVAMKKRMCGNGFFSFFFLISFDYDPTFFVEIGRI